MYDTKYPVSQCASAASLPTDEFTEKYILTRVGTSPLWSVDSRTRGGFYELVMHHARNPGRSPVLTG